MHQCGACSSLHAFTHHGMAASLDHWIVWQCCYLGCKTCLELAGGGLGPSELDRPKPSEKPFQSNAAHAAAACLTSACRPQVHDRIPAIHVAWPQTKLAGS